MMELLTQRDKNEFHAHQMLKTFFGGYDTNIGLVNNEVLLSLKEQFGEVKEKDRADVYVMFVDMLHKRNIKFNVKQFQI